MIRLHLRSLTDLKPVYFPNHSIEAVLSATDNEDQGYATVVLSSGLTYDVEETAGDVSMLRRAWELVSHYRVTNAPHTTAIGLQDGKPVWEFDHRMRNLSK